MIFENRLIVDSCIIPFDNFLTSRFCLWL